MAILALAVLVLSATAAATPLPVTPKLVHVPPAGTPVLALPVPVQGTVTTKNVATMLSQATPLLVVVPVVTQVTGLRARQIIHVIVVVVQKLAGFVGATLSLQLTAVVAIHVPLASTYQLLQKLRVCLQVLVVILTACPNAILVVFGVVYHQT